jgi:hypothetical protein
MCAYYNILILNICTLYSDIQNFSTYVDIFVFIFLSLNDKIKNRIKN